jgi:diguanylate cyclase (GGDEF)-like protein
MRDKGEHVWSTPFPDLKLEIMASPKKTSPPPPASHRAQQRRGQLFELAGNVSLLPSTLVAPMKVLQLHRGGNATMVQFGEAIAADPSLVSKIMGLVNSAAFKPANPITKLSHALVMIGLKNLLPLVFGVSMAGIFNKMGLPADERSAMWRASLLKAVTAREFARGSTPDVSEEAFVAALLQDIALPLIHAADRSAWPETIAVLELPDSLARTARERTMYACDHGELGAAMIKTLGLPDLYREATANHHAPSGPAAGDNAVLARALAIAAALPHRLALNVANLKARLLAALCPGAPQPADLELLNRIAQSYAETLAQFADADERSVAFKEFMQGLCGQVALCMESAIGESTTTIADLRDKGSDLERRVGDLKEQVAQSDYDALTRVFNRAGFMRRAGRFVKLARDHQAVSALGFVDIDDFKDLNDQYGHQAGDHALTVVAKSLVESLDGNGIVGRLGGDEFCFLLFAKDADHFAKAARHVENVFCRLQIDIGSKKIALTSSVGIAALDNDGPLEDLEQVLHAADKLMYSAKRAGKGRCNTHANRAA